MVLFKKYKNSVNNKKNNIVGISILSILVLVITLTIGFSAYQTSLDISTLAAYFRINKNIRVTNITLDNATNNAISNWEEYNTNNISASIDLPSSNSTITYEVEVTNLGNVEMGIFEISGLSNNLKYSISNYNLKDVLCDNINTSQCSLGSKSKFNITISYNNNAYDSSNTSFNIKLDFDFKRFYSISYVNIDDTNLPTKAIEGDNKEFYLNNPYPIRVHFTGNNGSYNAQSGKITLNNINDDVTISYVNMSYFLSYDGVDGYLFNNFNMSTITSFSRNTSLSLSQVENMVNNNTAYKISTNYNDQNYPSDYDIYGWVDNNKFYWWSEADIVYFHPLKQIFDV